MPGGTNLRYLIANHRGLSPPRKLLPLTIKQVLGWAKAYRRGMAAGRAGIRAWWRVRRGMTGDTSTIVWSGAEGAWRGDHALPPAELV